MEFKIYYENNKTKIIKANELNVFELYSISYIQPIHITHDFPKFKLSKPIIWKALVDYGFNPHAYSEKALRWSAINGHLDVVKYFVSIGCNPHICNEDALRWSAGNGHFDVVKYLVSIGCNPHAQNEHALRWSAMSGHLDVLKYLVSIGCDINKINLYVVNNNIKEYILKQKEIQNGI